MKPVIDAQYRVNNDLYCLLTYKPNPINIQSLRSDYADPGLDILKIRIAFV